MTDIDRERAVEDLKVVRTMMENCSRRQQDSGIYFIIWGLLIPVATGFNYLLVYMEKWNMIGLLWGGVGIIGCVLSIIFSARRQGEPPATHTGKVQSVVWIGSLISITLMMAGGFISRTMSLNMMMAVLAFMLAVAVFVSGFLSGTAMLKFIAAGWWVTGIICVFTHEYKASIVIGAATFILYFFPGVILYHRARKIRKTE